MRFLLSATALFATLATGVHAADPGRTIAVDCPINRCEDAVSLTFAGEFAIDTGTIVDGVEFGGISGIDYDAGTGH